MKLKYIYIKGLGVLVDESAEIKEGMLGFNGGLEIGSQPIGIHFGEDFKPTGYPYWKVIFAEKELNLDVPVFDWREFEVEQTAINWYKDKHPDSTKVNERSISFIAGHVHNKAKYTEEDLKKAIELAGQVDSNGEPDGLSYDEIIQSLKKTPKYVVMESEIEEFKLITSEGKQKGIIKEIIYKIKVAVVGIGTVDKCDHCGDCSTTGVACWIVGEWEPLDICHVCLKEYYEED